MNRLLDLDNKKKYIAPSVLAVNFANIEKDIKETEKAGIKILHLDVMDGHFVPNISMGQPFIAGIRKTTNMIFDTHLMISEPLKYVESFVKAGADHITFHIESSNEPVDVINKIKNFGISAGISIKPATKLESIFKYLDKIDMVLVMTVEPGFGGQAFIPDMLSKIKEISNEILKLNKKIFLQVDGGIDENTITSVSDNGANIFVAGTAVFRHPQGISMAIEKLNSKINN